MLSASVPAMVAVTSVCCHANSFLGSRQSQHPAQGPRAAFRAPLSYSPSPLLSVLHEQGSQQSATLNGAFL